MEKKCTMCKMMFPLTSFYRDKYKKDGYKVYCKTCDGSFHRNLDKNFLNERKRKRREKNRVEMNDSYWKRVGDRHKYHWEKLKAIYEEQEKKCFYCMTLVTSENLHVDHFYPQKSDKLVISCQDCNRLKWQRNGEEFMSFLKIYISRFS